MPVASKADDFASIPLPNKNLVQQIDNASRDFGGHDDVDDAPARGSQTRHRQIIKEKREESKGKRESK